MKIDFSKAKKNPYAKRLKKQITIRLEEPKKRKLTMSWRSTG